MKSEQENPEPEKRQMRNLRLRTLTKRGEATYAHAYKVKTKERPDLRAAQKRSVKHQAALERAAGEREAQLDTRTKELLALEQELAQRIQDLDRRESEAQAAALPVTASTDKPPGKSAGKSGK